MKNQIASRNTELNDSMAVNTIELMEKLASQSHLHNAAAKIMAIESADINDELKINLISQDISTLESQLNLSNRIRCQAIHPGDADEDNQREEENDEDHPLNAIAI